VWFSARHWEVDRELACDEAVLVRLDGPHRARYGRVILGVAQLLSLCRPVPGVEGAVIGRRFLRRRIVMIARYRRVSRRSTWLAAGVWLLLIPVGLTDAVALNARQNVRR